MKHLPEIAFCVAIFLLTPIASSGEEKETSIRDFSIETIEELGRELYLRDSIAASATDLLFERHPDARKMRFGGWVTEIGENTSRVYLLKRTDDAVLQAYVAVFPKEGEPTIEEHLDEAIPESVNVRLLARSTAIQAIPGFYDRPYNFEVLDDPDGEGFIVYSLAATKDANEIVVGGHSRVTVSADGKIAETTDELSKSLLILQKSAPEGEIEAFTMSHIVSATPVETHVFLSLMHEKPFYVSTGKKSLWKIEDGSISEIEMEPKPEAPGHPSTVTESKSEGREKPEPEGRSQ